MPERRVVVLASGTGSLLQSILDSSLRPHVVAVGSDIASAPALEKAREAGVPTFVVPMVEDRDEWDESLLAQLREHRATVIVAAGFMRILGNRVVDAYRNQIVNSHPALLPSFPGAHGVRDALRYGVKVTGCTVHLVDSGVDTGPIIAQQSVTVEDTDTEESLHERIKEVERVLLVDVVSRIVREGISVEGRSVAFG